MLDVLINNPGKEKVRKGILKVSDRADKPLKSILKAISWRAVGTLDTMVISYIITGKVTVALSIGSIEVISKTFLYYLHERVWAHIHNLKFKIFRRKDERKSYSGTTEKPAQGKVRRRINEDSCVQISG